MAVLTPTRKTNPCAVCGDTNGRCRQAEWGLLCMSLHQGIAPGYRCIGVSSDGLWGKWVEAETELDRDSWETTQRERKALEARKRAESLTPFDRDILFEQLFSQLELHPDDLADLTRRGLTEEQIELGGFKSVEPHQSLKERLDPALPGVAENGRSLNTSHPGYLCPVRDVDDFIVGCQIRLRTTTDGRYRWLSNALGPHLQNGELPLAVHRPQTENKVVGMVEGVGVKPFVASQRLKQVFIGAAGGLFAASPQTLLNTLEVLQPSAICFYPDAGAIANYHILQQYQSSWTLIEEFGLKIQIAWWGQISKGLADIDELESFEKVQYITPSAFWMKAKTIALADHQVLVKTLGVTPTAEQKNQVHRMRAIELLRSNSRMKMSQELFYYRESVRVLMHQVGIDWSHPVIQKWLDRHKLTRETMRLHDLKDLKAKLDAIAQRIAG